MSSPTQHGLSPSDVAALVDVSFGVGVAGCVALAGGGFATVWWVRLGDGRQTVLKVAPPPDVRLLRYERGLIAAEADYFRLVRARVPGVPVPDVLYHGTDRRVFDSDWLFTSYLPGTALPDLRRSGTDDATVRSELGAAVGRIHTVTGPRFGYSGQRAHASTWYVAFARMVDDLLADADAWRVRLPRPPQAIRKLVARHAGVLAAVDRPTLVHFDLWDGNVLASRDADGVAHLTGLVDGERHLFGDPLIDFVSPALYRRIEAEPQHPFLRGYAESTGTPLDFDASARRRLALYRMHLLLLMTVEMPSRGMTAESHAARRQRVSRLVAGELAELDRPQ